MKHINSEIFLKEAFSLEPIIPVREEKILQAVESSMRKLEQAQFEQPIDIWEFLFQQSRFIKKNWWLMQAILLCLLYWYVQLFGNPQTIRQALGIAAPLFVILVIPELWKNTSNNALDIEGTTMYTLQQVYAARLILFAGVDLLLLSVFCICTSLSHTLSLWDIMTQFIIPMNVTCCIALTCLYCPRIGNQSFSILLCLLFAMMWREVVRTEQIYKAITIPTWYALLFLSMTYMGYCLFRGQQNLRQYMAIRIAGNERFYIE